MSQHEAYIEALREMVSGSKQAVVVAAAPLAIVLTQLRFLSAIDSWWISLIATITVLGLFLATAIGWYLYMVAQSFLALELHDNDGLPPKKGQVYRKYITEMWGENAKQLTEEGYVELCQSTLSLFQKSLIAGYFGAALLLIGLIWS